MDVKQKKLAVAWALSAIFVVVVLLSVLLPILLKKEVAHIIVLAGQSNCEGVSSNQELEKYVSPEKFLQYQSGIENVKIAFNTNGVHSPEFVSCKFGQGTSKDHFGIELGIADWLNEKFPKEEFYLVKRAHGGTSIFPFWHAPDEDLDGGMYLKALLETLDRQIATLQKQGKKVVIEAFCWMQGEQDASSFEFVQTYSSYLSKMVAYFRARYAAFNSKPIKFVDGGISKYDLQNPYYYQEINAIKKAFSETDENNFYIDTIQMGLTLHLEPKDNPDLIHYDSIAMLKLGQAFGELSYSK